MYNQNDLKDKGDYLRHILRRHPEELKLKMSSDGWVSTTDLLNGLVAAEKNISLADIIAVMKKTRTMYSFKDDSCTYIRANYGHSLGFKLEDIVGAPASPMTPLYHGTANVYIKTILQHGILPQGRDHIFLTSDFHKACEYGMRHGVPAVIKVIIKKDLIKQVPLFHPCSHIWLAYNIPANCISEVIEFQEEGIGESARETHHVY